MAELRGVIKRVIFSDSATGFFVFSVQTGAGLQKAKGTFLFDAIREGAEIGLEGDWEETKFGPTFHAKRILPQDLTTVAGVEKYLAQYVPSIGAVTAKKIVDHFGMATMEVLSQEPERLKEIPRMTAAQIAHVTAEWHRHVSFRDTAIHLMDWDLSPSVIKRIYETWGDGSLAQIKANPYILTAIRGISFNAADNVALRLGIPLDSPFRLAACMEYALTLASQGAGHLYLHVTEIMDFMDRMVFKEDVRRFGRTIVTEDFKAAIKDLKARDRVVVQEGRVYLKALYQYEHEAARLLKYFMAHEDAQGGDSRLDLDVDGFAEAYEAESGVSFSEEQREALAALPDHRVLLITGLPGTGKTTVMKAVVQYFIRQNKTVHLMSPTGIAAKKLASVVGRDAGTIHRVLGGFDDASDWVYHEGKYFATDVVVVDEFSMVDQHLFYRLLAALKPSTRLVLVGDHAQLPSVGAGNVLSDLIRSGAVRRVHLTQIFRQDETNDIVLNAHRINAGAAPVVGNPKDPHVHFKFIEYDAESNILDGLLTVVARLAATADKDTTFQVLSPKWKDDLGVTNLNLRIREVLNPLEGQRQHTFRNGVVFREGDRVMVRENDYTLGVFNGETGTVQEINAKDSKLWVRFKDDTITKVVPFPFDSVGDLLTLAFCITIHKSQGQEYDYVILPFVRSFTVQLQRNLLYTAITRARHSVYILGEWRAIDKAVQNNDVARRNSFFAERLVALLDETVSSG